ncbi:methionyl-tRNA synthetase, putative [Babesia bigemina]|uniref:methionine--tRNA ligase n=1 Tax=Babesia bigemina TaxID=5866 RepID=A0A061DDT0_BABBI|nr:methionyl-tRNA synthetase, putative [Babesia bigemina]CDR97664.1 methionyl-tRNA synthetase, putative [Babesia bigemina]|eukprot:XP_012769850.1 methionyl-tRNA synthetase, putative [Babesia bigemina]
MLTAVLENGNNVTESTGGTTLVTTPLFYVNGELHVGHAYTLVAADVIKRYEQLLGRNALLLSGTDEHGTKIEAAARAAGQTLSRYVEDMRTHYHEVLNSYNVNADVHIHTAADDHGHNVRWAFNHLLHNGDIYEGLHKGYFSPAEDAYYTAFQITNGLSPQGFEVQPVAEKAYFFRLSKYQDALRQLIGTDGFLTPKERRNEALSLLKGDLPDVAITRSNTRWGVPLDLPGFEDHTIYVWFDALMAYALRSRGGKHHDNTIMVFGKDILRFIALLWPALLMSLDMPLPRQMICHGWLTCSGEKISKSKGEKVLALPTLGTADVSRFVLMSLGAFGEDFNFDSTRVEQLSELVKDKYANLTHRITGLMNNRGVYQLDRNEATQMDPLVKQLLDGWGVLRQTMQHYRIDLYISELNRLAAEINSYITRNQLWGVQSEGDFRRHCLVLCRALLVLTVYLYPIMPNIARMNMERLQPHIKEVPVGIGAASDILQTLAQVDFNPRHLAPLM